MLSPTHAAVRAFLRRSLIVQVATLSPKKRPFVTPLWFVLDRGALYITTGPETWAGKNVTQQPEVVLLFSGERVEGSDQVLRLRGTATCHRGLPSWQVLLRIAAKYYFGGLAWKAPGAPGLHRRLVWLAVWLMPVGLAISGFWPAYRVPALHILFIGGFGLLAFGVATHVALAHLDLERLAFGGPPAVMVLGVTFVLAMQARLAADVSTTYFDHLGWAATFWIVGSAVWLGFLGPKLLRR